MRARLLAAGQFGALNARVAPMSPSGSASATTVSGVLKVPAILLRFKDSPAPSFVPAEYDAVLFAATPPAGRPYTYRSFYRQLSDSVFDIQGSTLPQVNLDSNEVWYTGGTNVSCVNGNPFGSTNCNGLFNGAAFARMQSGLREALTKLDLTVDFSQFADSTGAVPLVLFLHQAMGGECGPLGSPQNHLWAHRSAISAFTTNDNDPFHAGTKVRIGNYILQPSVGGAGSCNTSQIMPIGTVAHETGHGFGLPDLYDTGAPTEGIGQWGLMSSGSFTSGFSPARMEAWSLNELGWITLVPLTAAGTYSFDAAPLADTAYYVRVQGTNPRGEYFLLENRQRQQSDSALIRIHCALSGNPPGCGGGLLIWHVDSAKLAQGAFSNTVNSGAIHGLALVQADGFRNLEAPAVQGNSCSVGAVVAGCSDRGDAGDLYPGTSGNTALVFRTNPAALKNLDGSFAGFGVDSIQQLVANRTMSFGLRFGALTVVRASDTAATIQFAGAGYKVYRDMLDEGQGYAVNFADPQTIGRTRYNFVSWSDGGAVAHTYVGHVLGDTLQANVSRDFKLTATSGSGGTIQADTAIDLIGGTFITEGRAVTLTATADSGQTFGGWSGDTVTLNAVVVLPMGRPYTLSATFGTLAISSATARPNGVMGAAYADTLRSGGGTGTNNWVVTAGALPLGVTLDGPTGIVSGFPRQTGNFSFTATVTSGAQSQAKVFTFSVTAPTLATADVTTQLLGPTAPLNADQVRYLDFLGNNNSVFDIGDFLAWVKATGAPLSAAAISGTRRKGGSR